MPDSGWAGVSNVFCGDLSRGVEVPDSGWAGFTLLLYFGELSRVPGWDFWGDWFLRVVLSNCGKDSICDIPRGVLDPESE